ncbi:hypothetical protein TREES_T100014780 [Tupaia chinensis]|uniref:Uncharacterized protein n=1 Tax=Tupaia chinensis TaxID=246437 RepID=L9KTH2_TUPCH|nr:hypothetical protein TREES_T100014780 [Tupaia chinensis]
MLVYTYAGVRLCRCTLMPVYAYAGVHLGRCALVPVYTYAGVHLCWCTLTLVYTCAGNTARGHPGAKRCGFPSSNSKESCHRPSGPGSGSDLSSRSNSHFTAYFLPVVVYYLIQYQAECWGGGWRWHLTRVPEAGGEQRLPLLPLASSGSRDVRGLVVRIRHESQLSCNSENAFRTQAGEASQAGGWKGPGGAGKRAGCILGLAAAGLDSCL